MRFINKVILIGNVGKDLEVKYFDSGRSVANFTLATTERGYTTANGIQVPDRTDWHNWSVFVSSFGRQKLYWL